MMQLNDPKRIFGLDLMRAAAILLVLFGHCIWIFPEMTGLGGQLLAISGFMGVEVFFVLSGFLIGKILYRLFLDVDFTFSSVVYFLKRRWFRTLPNYFLILLINIIVAAMVGYEVPQVWKYFFFLQNFASPLLPFFTESWSLSVEEFAYLVLPFVLLAAVLIFRRNKSLVFLLTVLALIFVFIGTKMYYNSQIGTTTLQYWNLAVKSVVIYRLDSIFIGVLFSWLYYNYTEFWVRAKMSMAFVGCLIFGLLFVGVGYFQIAIETYPFFWNVLYLPVSSVMVALFLPVLSEWKAAPVSIVRPITFISLISYSIYLLHYGIILQLLKNFVIGHFTNTFVLLGCAAGYVGITIFLSYLLYRFYEKPMMDLRDR